jgi:hypothetical protein
MLGQVALDGPCPSPGSIAGMKVEGMVAYGDQIALAGELSGYPVLAILTAL